MKPYALKDMTGSRTLINGGMGFIGSNLAHKLVGLGAKVTILDAMLKPYGGNNANIEGIEDSVEFIKGDARDPGLMKKVVKDKDCIFNVFAQVSHTLSMEKPFLDLDINCRGNLNVLESCRLNNEDVRIVYAGTRGSTGNADYIPVDEKHPDNPPDMNGIDKWAAEKYHLLYHNVYGIPSSCIRLGNTYGPRHQMKHSQYGVLNWFIRQAMLGETIEVHGTGNALRDYNYVDDVADAMILLSQNKSADGEYYLIGGGEKIRFIDMVKRVVETVGKGNYVLKPRPENRERIEVKQFFADYSKLTKATSWTPQTSFSEGLEKTVMFYEKNLEKYV